MHPAWGNDGGRGVTRLRFRDFEFRARVFLPEQRAHRPWPPSA